MPERAAYAVDFAEPRHGRRGLRFEEVVVDAQTGAQVSRRGYVSGTSADRFIAWQYPLHSGQIAGLTGRILICVTGLIVAMLSVTGVLIWWKKRQAHIIAGEKWNKEALPTSTSHPTGL